MKRFKIVGIVFGVVLFVYTLFGFFALPGIVKKKLAETLSDYTGCPVSIGELSVNPLVLSTTIRDFSLKDKQGEPLIAFDELYINFESNSLFRGGYAFSEITLKSPSLHFLTRTDGSVNVQDLIPPDDKKDTVTVAKEEPPIVVMVEHLQMIKGEIVYEDRKRRTPFVAKLDSLNLSLRDFATRPEDKGVYQFQALTDKGEGLKWRGTISVMPFRSAGNLALTGFKARTFWEYVQDMFNFEVTDGLTNFQADYELDLSGKQTLFNIRNGSASANSVRIADRKDSSEAVFISSLSVKGLESEINKNRVRIGEIRGDAGRLFVAYQPGGTISLKTLFLPKPDPTSPPDTAATPWVVTVDKIAIGNYSIVAEDRTVEPAAHLKFSSVGLSVENYIYGIPNKAAKLEVTGRMKEGGSLALTGGYIPEPLSGEMKIKVDSLDLRPFQTYVGSFGKIDLKSGLLSVAGSTRFRSKGETMTKDFKGDVWLESFRLVDHNLGQDFLRWARLDMRRIAYNDSPSSISVAEIVARRPYLRFIIGPDRISNLQHILGKTDSLSRADSLAIADTTKKSSPPAMATRIGNVRVIDGSMNFSDLSLTPNFAVGIQNLNGTIKGLSSEQLARADVDLTGKVDKYAPAVIRGQINPLSEDAYTDILLSFKSIELTTFTPYSGKFAGYKIDKGKLNLDLHYVLSQSMLIGENKIVLDQLTLGESVDSPDATSLPLRLAIALLKDSRGVIDIDLPISGNINDPQFSIMPIVFKALLNLVVKIVTSPFRLLGALFGGGEEMQYVGFVPGAESIPAPERSKLDSLANALTQRPELKLDVRGGVAFAADREALATQTINAQLNPEGGSVSLARLTKAQRERLLKLYTATFKEDPGVLVPEKDEAGNSLSKDDRNAKIAEAAYQQLIRNYPVSENDLRVLAQKRAAAIKDRLVTVGKVDEVRIFLQDVDLKAEADSIQVKTQLSLDAR